MRKKNNQRQLLFNNEFKAENEFGGAHLKKSHAKRARPISTKSRMHLTLRSSRAKGEKSFRFNKGRITQVEKIVRAQAKKFSVEIFRYANVGNHLHLLVKASYRKGFISFLRAISGILARIALGAEKGCAKLEATSQFWDQRPWTRIVLTWTELKNVEKYIEQNVLEAIGFVAYKPRKYLSTA